MKFHFLLRRSTALFLAALVLLLSIVPDTAYASAPVPNVSPATPFDASFPDDFIGSGDFMTKYEKSFEYCPKTIDDVLNPKSRFALSTTLIYIFTVILAACGIYISVEDSIVSIFTSFESWLRTNYGNNASVMITWQDILNGAVAGTIVGMRTFIPIFKKYLNSSVDGYGTSRPEYSFNSGSGTLKDGPYVASMPSYISANDFVYVASFAKSASQIVDIAIPSSYDITPVALYSSYRVNRGYVYVVGFDSNNNYVSFYYVAFAKRTYNASENAYIHSEVTYTGTCNELPHDSSAESFGVFVGNSCNLPVFKGEDYARAYVKYGVTDGMFVGSPDTVIQAQKSWSGLQTKDDATNIDYGDALVIPSAQDAIDQILAALSAAQTAKEATEALAPSLTVIEGGASGGETEEDPEKLPWFPSVSKWFNDLQLGVDNIIDKVSAIPDAMIDIKNDIAAIPGQITDFFTLDTTVVSASFASLQDTFEARFGGITQLGTVFKRSYALDMVIPVFSVKVPPELSQLFPYKSEIVIMDLRPYRDYFLWGRNLLIAMFWVAFAKWLLDQFDVKLNVG